MRSIEISPWEKNKLKLKINASNKNACLFTVHFRPMSIYSELITKINHSCNKHL